MLSLSATRFLSSTRQRQESIIKNGTQRQIVSIVLMLAVSNRHNHLNKPHNSHQIRHNSQMMTQPCLFEVQKLIKMLDLVVVS